MRTNRNHLAIARRESWMKVKDPAKLKRKRMNRKFTQRELAFLVRRSQTTIYLLETGRQKTLTEDLAVSIAARLGVDWEDYFDLEEGEVMPSLEGGKYTTSRDSEVAAS